MLNRKAHENSDQVLDKKAAPPTLRHLTRKHVTKII